MGKIKTGETELTIGTIADGQYLKRTGTEIVSAAVSGSGGGGVVYDTQANRPAAGTQGREFIPTNGYGPTRQIDSGAAWINFYNGFQCSNPPAYNSFTAVNQANSTLAADSDGLLLTLMGSNSTSILMETYLTALPASPYVFIVGMYVMHLHPIIYGQIGTILTNGTANSDEAVIFSITGGSSGIPTHDIQSWTNYGFASSYQSAALNRSCPMAIYIKIEDDNTNRKFSLSSNGKDYYLYFSHARTTHITPTHCGLFVVNSTTAVATNITRAQAKIFHWSLG